MDKIINSIKRLEQVVERELPKIKTEVKRMITDKETSTKKIEHMLDTLLNLAYMGRANDEFVMLNGYYSTINKSNAEFYTHCHYEITHGL